MKDVDGDGFGDKNPPEGILNGSDCDDNSADIFPGADEICDGIDTDCDQTVPENEIDNDNDGLIDLDDPGCRDARDTTEKETQCADTIDNDGDGLVDSFDPGCGSPEDDNEENPPLAAQCADGRDNDANGLVDEQGVSPGP